MHIGGYIKPSLHSHLKLPGEFMHEALVTFPAPQFPLFIKHSSISISFYIFKTTINLNSTVND